MSLDHAATILVVDDNDASRYAVARTLRQAGFETIEASTGREGLELAGRLPAAIILDVRLPDILGYEVCRRIKENPLTSAIPVLQMSTVFLDNESRIYALESGADAYLMPPIEPTVLAATVRSLVRLHRAESQSRLAASQWQATFDALKEGAAVIDSSGIVQRCNLALARLLNESRLAVEKHPLPDLLKKNFGIANDCREEIPFQEIQFNDRFFQMSLSPVYMDEVQTSSIFVVLEITERKKAEAALLVSERLIATGRMANTIAHEINNPLEAITNLLYLLNNLAVSPKDAKEYLRLAQEELGRVSKIARQILSFNRESTVPVEVNLAELLDDVLALNNRGVANKNLEVIKDWDSGPPVKGFPAQLRQVFSNLLRNAIEASYHDGKIRIRISEASNVHDGTGRVARVTIADQGLGIPSENLARIFDAFFTTKDLKGSGVGLWLSASIVEEHRGRIQVRSSTRVGHSGTCISVILPCELQSARPSSPQQLTFSA